MAHQRPPKQGKDKFRIPVPENPAQLQAYLDMNWLLLPGGIGQPPHLFWSHARGSPRHPGDSSEPVYQGIPLLGQLPMSMMDMASSSLPSAMPDEPQFAEVHLLVRVRYRRKYLGARKRGQSYGWTAEDADAQVLPKD